MTNTVYILGAGASRAATAAAEMPTPLAADFFKEVYLDEYWYDLEYGGAFKDSALNFILSRYFASDSKSGGTHGIDNINIEEVYSFLHSYDRVFQSTSLRRDAFQSARQQLHKYIIDVIRYTSWRAKDIGFLKRLVATLDSEDSIITFNWDTLIEQALMQSKRKVCRALLDGQFRLVEDVYVDKMPTWNNRMERHHQSRLIKVHGSISYTRCSNASCRRHQFPFVWELSEESPEYWDCTECGSPTEVMILPPHGAKTYSASNFFRLQAGWAASKLSLARRIVLIGYSVPVFDIEARSMLRSARLDDDESEAWLEEVVVVDPQTTNEKYVSEIRNLLGVDNYAAHGHSVAFKTYQTIDGFEKESLK